MADDPTATRKKFLLARYVKRFNERNPTRRIPIPAKFDYNPNYVGEAARELLRSMQGATGLDVTGYFNKPTMRKLLPPGIRGEVMACVHAEVGEHEWPPSSNMGEIVKYLHSVGLGGGYPWCAAFATWVLKEEGFKHFPPGPASADSWGRWAQQKGITKPRNASLFGDLWCWEWGNSDGMLDHIGFCDEGINGVTAYYVDGNVGAYGGSVTDASRAAGNIAVTIDLVKLHNLR